ncbi:hypothetical protein PISMIDRAFT_470858 [Pisolithus microcarpus 441]|uniref:Unplaced genomic scaffold scaffold_47, whole genome shotgun sequence n=1 Tax=Pisolithus microcarpus 441 TaxID=765257 RepID=A0A0C9Z1Z0_9AGAM|nr:hypothetical protein PISMIDRAFT_470858 [Pisolithus microcarpus 441]
MECHRPRIYAAVTKEVATASQKCCAAQKGPRGVHRPLTKRNAAFMLESAFNNLTGHFGSQSTTCKLHGNQDKAFTSRGQSKILYHH